MQWNAIEIKNERFQRKNDEPFDFFHLKNNCLVFFKCVGKAYSL